MSPEAPGNLVLLNLQFQDDELTGTVERISPPQEQFSQGRLRVRFDAPTKEQGFFPVGDGVSWISTPKDFVHQLPESLGTVPSPGDLRFYYNHVAYGEGLMLLLILPEGYTLADSDPVPRGAKLFHDRLVVYFKPAGNFGSDTRVTWALRKINRSRKEELERLHKRVLNEAKASSHSGVVVDDEDPELGRTEPIVYARMALIAGLIGVGLLIFYVVEAKNLVPGVQNRVYFVVLLAAALACSIALFGILRSKAHIKYKHYGTIVELSGAAALFWLIVYFGSSIQGPDTFDLTVRVHSDEEAIIREGTITLDFGSDRRVETIDNKGEANFKRVPPEFSRATVKMIPRVDGYEEKPQEHAITGSVVDVTLVKAHYRTTLSGSVEPLLPDKTLLVKVEGQAEEATVNKYGEFNLQVTGKAGDKVRVWVFVNGKRVYDDYQFLPGPVMIKLHNLR